ncbi:unnamed protein product [Polarella glacialis]|uniref:Uncharacterized protein n=1 Tax=Polarella glacialis TaxID=89957 RepID=A0A813EVZ0_POLGL|nr:unnamed protein product [Polarella glacialis]CAE8642157.1 unnamed protein product [Polarella glacialis]CAE8700515.1 unnamed protein product [Polarella glacialis]CAE8725991.1 unnamed protein product [Polarella glacialis]
MTDPAVDAASVPLPVVVAVLALVGVLLPLRWLWLGTPARKRTPQESHARWHILAGLHQILFGLPLALLIPHARIPKAVALAHSIALIQGSMCVVFGLLWPSLKMPHWTSKATTAINLYGFYFNIFGVLWGAFTGARDLLYVTKLLPDVAALPRLAWAEAVLHVLLKTQGAANVVGVCLMSSYAAGAV